MKNTCTKCELSTDFQFQRLWDRECRCCYTQKMKEFCMQLCEGGYLRFVGWFLQSHFGASKRFESFHQPLLQTSLTTSRVSFTFTFTAKSGYSKFLPKLRLVIQSMTNDNDWYAAKSLTRATNIKQPISCQCQICMTVDPEWRPTGWLKHLAYSPAYSRFILTYTYRTYTEFEQGQ